MKSEIEVVVKHWVKGVCLLLLVISLLGRLETAAGHSQAEKRQAGALASELIKDRLILAGWEYLEHLSEPLELQQDQDLSGRDLAQFLLEKKIPVVWDDAGICRGGSCSQLYCEDGGDCFYDDGRPGVDPIYLNPEIMASPVDQVRRVAGELAHEIFHRTQPFGRVSATQLEEYWAFYIGAEVSGSAWPNFAGVNPLDRSQLSDWFKAQGMNSYLSLAAYPGEAPSSAGAARQAQGEFQEVTRR